MSATETGRSELTPANVVEYIADEHAPQTMRDYGPKIPTRYRLKLTDGRTRRVYVDVYGNGGGTPYVLIGGGTFYLSADVEHTLSA